MKSAERSILFLPGYGEDSRMCKPFQDSLQELTGRPVITGDYYDAAVRRRTKSNRYAPSHELAMRVLVQLMEADIDISECDIVGHSYGGMIADELVEMMGEQRQMILIAPAGVGKVDPGLPARFAIGMSKDTLRRPDTARFAMRGVRNTLRRPDLSALEAVELSRANDLEHFRGLGDRALVLTYAADPVFDDEKTARILLRDEDSEVAVVSPIDPRRSRDGASADHSRLFTQPRATAVLVAERLSGKSLHN